MSADATPSGRKAFNQGEIAAILKVAQGEWRTCILFGLYFGMRLGDARRRSYEEIEDGNLRFLPEKKSRLGKVVTVPLMGELQTLRGQGLITPTLAAMEHGTASKHFSQLLDRAGIVRVKTTKRGEGRGLTDKTFHSWRHTTNSLLAEAGIDQRVRQLICDHDSVRVSNRYTAVSIDTMAKAITKAIKLPS
jgi:integrase